MQGYSYEIQYGRNVLRMPKLPSTNLDDTPDTPQVRILELSRMVISVLDIHPYVESDEYTTDDVVTKLA